MTTNSPTPAESRLSDLSDELNELDIPILPVTDMIMTMCDADEWTAGYVAFFDAVTTEGGERSHLMIITNDLLDTALESVSQLPHIRRALEIADEVEELDNEDQEYSGRHGL